MIKNLHPSHRNRLNRRSLALAALATNKPLFNAMRQRLSNTTFSASFKFLSMLVLVLLISGNSWGQFTNGNIVVLQVGDGSTALSASSTAAFLKEFTTAGVAGTSVTIPSTGATALTLAGSGGTEGYITRSSDGNSIVIPGFNAVAGVATIATSASSTNPRAIGKVNIAGTFSLPVTTTSFTAKDPRGAASDGTNYWGTGATTGVVLEAASGAGTIVSTTNSTNNRTISIYNGNLYYSTGGGTVGIYQVGTGLPTTTGTVATLLFTPAGSTPSPYQFAFNATGTICYIADDANGIYKYTYSAGAWSAGTQVCASNSRGLIVDFSGSNPVIYATTSTASSGNTIIKFTDSGSGYPLSPTTIATAPTNTAYRGIAFAPAAAVTPTKLAFSTITSTTAAPIYAGTSFSAILNAQDGSSVNQNVTSTTGGTLSASTGTISPTTYSIANGANTQTQSVTLNTAGTGISLSAATPTSGMTGLTAATSNNFTVYSAIPAVATAVTTSLRTTTGTTVTWVRGGGDGVVVVARLTPAAAVAPTLGTQYTPTSAGVYGGITTGTGNYVVYNGTGTSIGVTNLANAAGYTYDVYEYKGSTTTMSYSAAASSALTSTLATAPSAPASNVQITAGTITQTGMTATWTNGTGGAGRLVVARLSSTTAVAPTNGTPYTPSTNGSFTGTTLTGAANGNVVIYSGTASTIAVTNLTANNAYTYDVYEYSGSSTTINYAVAASSASTTTLVTAPTTLANTVSVTSNTISSTGMTVTWNNGNGAGRIVVARLNATSAVAPVGGTAYTPVTPGSFTGNPTDGTAGNIVVYNGTGTSIAVTNLANATAYAFDVYEYNGSSPTIAYAAKASSSSTSTLSAVPTTAANAVAGASILQNTLTLNWTSGNGANRIVVARLTATSAVAPTQATTYTPSSAGSFTGTTLTGASNGNVVIYNGNAATVNVTNLTANTSYTFDVYEYNGSGATAAYYTAGTSSPTTTLALAAPGAPTITGITAGAASLSVAFTAGNDGGSAITTYKYSTDGGLTFRTRASGTTASPISISTLSSDGTTALVNGTTYQVQIKAVNAINDGTATASTAGTPALQYCASTGPASAGSDYFTNFTASGSAGGINNTGTFSANGYGDFTVQSVSQQIGGTVNYSATSPGIGNGSSFGIFIDWNQDGDFADANETVFLTVAQISTNPSGSFTVPVGATLGNTRMRIVVKDAVGSVTSCNSAISNSETEDYTFTVVAATPTITASAGSLSTVNTTYGTASSTTTSFTVSGSSMTEGILITPPSGFEVSQTAGGASGYAGNGTAITVGAAGTIASTTIYVRLAATATVAGSPYSGNIVLTSSGATTVNKATVSSTVTPKGLTISGITGTAKLYDGGTTASFTGTPSYVGLANSESFSVTGTPSVAFATAAAGPLKSIVVSGYTAPSGNYSLTQPSLSADINTVGLTITGITADNKTFDGTTTATLSGTPAYYGLVNGETFSVTGTPVAAFIDAAVGTTKTVNVSGYTPPSSNYTLTQPSLTADITPAVTPTISPSGTLTALSTVYGTASTASSFTVVGSSLTNDILVTPPTGFEVSQTLGGASGYSATQTLAQTGGNVASTTIYVRLKATSAVNSYSGNVVLSSTGATDATVATVSSTVSTKALTITGLTANSKQYDGFTTVIVTGTAVYTGLVNSEGFTVSDVVTFAFTTNGNVGTGKAITQTGLYTVPSANYSITQPTLTADITAAPLTITATAQSKNFGSTSLTTGSTAFTPSGLQNTDAIGTVSLAYSGSPAGNLATAIAGTYTITPSAPVFSTGISSNYTISYTTGTLTINAVVPGAPTIGTATAGNGQVTVAYSAPSSNGGSVITTYTATSSPGGFTGSISQAGSGSITVTGLTNGTAYTFTVTATNSAGAGSASAASGSATPRTVPDAPTIGTAAVAGVSGTATVSFTAPLSNGGSIITSYSVTTSPAGGTGTLNQAGSGTITVTGLTNGTAYTFTVKANNIAGASAASGASNSVTPYTVPGAPTIGTAAVGGVSGTATVSYTAPASNGGSVITSYTATSSPGGFTGTLTQAGGGTITVSGLTDGTAYTFTVTATNAAGTGSASVASNSITPTLPAPVASAASSVLSGSFTANWAAVAGASGYKLDVATNNTFISGSFTNLVAWNFPNNPDDAIADGGIAANNAKTITSTATGGISAFAAMTNPVSTTSVATANTNNAWISGQDTKWWEVDFATTGYYNIRFSSLQRSSNTGPKNFKVQYKLGSGGTYADVTSGSISIANDWSTGQLTNITLPSSCDNQSSVYLRWIMTTNTSVNNGTVLNTGTSSIDNILVEGNGGAFVPNYHDLTVNATSQSVSGLSANTTYYYRVRATSTNSTSANSNLISATTASNPTAFNMTGTASYCAGGSGVAVGLDGSQLGINYQLFVGGSTPVGSVVPGTGAALAFGTHTAGTYTASGTADGSVSTIDGTTAMSGSAVVTANPLPVPAGTISGTATVCQGQATVGYSVSAVTNATSYQWAYSGIGATITGSTNNITITFAANATAGNLTVYGVNACGNGTVSADYAVAVNPLPVAPTSANVDRTNFCADDAGNIVLTYSGGSGSTLKWYAGGCGSGTSIGTGNNLSIASPTATTDYYARWENGCGNSTCVSVTVTVKAIPIAQAGDPNALAYQNVLYSFPGSATSGGTVVWSQTSGFTLGTFVASPPSFIPSPTSGGSAAFNVTVTSTTGCGTATDNITLWVMPTNPLTWSGNFDASSWYDSRNWAQAIAPTAASEVEIPSNATRFPTLTAAATCKTIIVRSGASLIDNGFLSLASGGSIIVEHAAIAPGAWHFISSPVSGVKGSLFAGNFLQSFTPAGGYAVENTPGKVLPAMQGFALWPKTDPFTAPFVGGLDNAASHSIAISNAGSGVNQGWNLVGNPYPSAIDWDASLGWSKDNVVDNAVYIYTGGANWSSYVHQAGTNNGSRYIAPMQGFFVKASGVGSLVMTNAVRVHNSVPYYYKNSDAVVPNLVRLEVSGNGYKDEAVVRFSNEATAEFDGDWDALKRFGDLPAAAQLYTVGSIPLSINSLPEAPMVPVGLQVGANGSYTIAATEINDLHGVTLEDTETGILTDLSSGSYTFDAVAGTSEQRFKLIFSMLSVPVSQKVEATIYSYQQTVHINLKDQAKGDIYIYNIAGQLVSTKLAAQGTNEIKLPNAGNYIVKVISKNSTVVRKVFIQK